MRARSLALLVALVVALPALAVAPAVAGDPWRVAADGLVDAHILPGASTSEIRLDLEDRTSLLAVDDQASGLLELLGLHTGYSQVASWQGGDGPSLACPNLGIDILCQTSGDSGWVLLPQSGRATLVAHGPDHPGRTRISVAPANWSVAYDAAYVSIILAIEVLTGESDPITAQAPMVVELAVRLTPEAVGIADALARGDGTAAAQGMAILGQRAYSVISEHLVAWSEAIGMSLVLRLVPPLAAIKLAIASAHAIVPLIALTGAILTPQRSEVILAWSGDPAQAGSPAPGTEIPVTSPATDVPSSPPAEPVPPGTGGLELFYAGQSREPLGAGLDAVEIHIGVRNAGAEPLALTLPDTAGLRALDGSSTLEGRITVDDIRVGDWLANSTAFYQGYFDFLVPPGVTICSVNPGRAFEKNDPVPLQARFSISQGGRPAWLSVDGFPDIDVSGEPASCADAPRIAGSLPLPATVPLPIQGDPGQSAFVEFKPTERINGMSITVTNPSATGDVETDFDIWQVNRDGVLTRTYSLSGSEFSGSFVGPIDSASKEYVAWPGHDDRESASLSRGAHWIFFDHNTGVLALLGR